MRETTPPLTAEARSEEPGSEPWVLRAAARVPGSPWAQGAALAVLVLAIELVATLLTAPPARLDFTWFRALSLPLLTGYALAATREGTRTGERALRDLEPVLVLDENDRRALGRELHALPRPVRATALAVGVAVPIAVGLALPEVRDAALAGHPQLLTFWAMATFFWWIAGQGLALLLVQGRVFRRIGRYAVRVDLFRTRSLAPFGRVGLRSAVLVSGALALAVLLAATPGSSAAWLPRLEIARGIGALATILVASGAAALAALVLPLLGIRRRLGEEKARAVARLEDALPHHEVETGAVLAGGASRAAAVLALRDRIQAVPDWPVDAAMRRRFGLYALLPVASWLAKTLVEHGVEALLG